jgi:anti-sigma factor RsiW
MNCREISSLSHAYVDDELDVVRTLDLDQHFAECQSCSREHQELKALKNLLKPDGLYFEAPSQLERRVRRALAFEPPGRKPGLEWFPWWSTAAIGVVSFAVVALLLWLTVFSPSTGDRLAQEVTASHIRSLMVDHKTDVASSDQHTVKPWFDGKLDFAPPVVDLADHGFPLIGGRLDYLQNRSVAALVYQRNKHFINVFIWPGDSRSGAARKLTTRQGYNLVQWNHAGMTFWAVSDLNAAELADFSKLLE